MIARWRTLFERLNSFSKQIRPFVHIFVIHMHHYILIFGRVFKWLKH